MYRDLKNEEGRSKPSKALLLFLLLRVGRKQGGRDAGMVAELRCSLPLN